MAIVTQSCLPAFRPRDIGRAEEQRPETCLHLGRHVLTTSRCAMAMDSLGFAVCSAIMKLSVVVVAMALRLALKPFLLTAALVPLINRHIPQNRHQLWSVESTLLGGVVRLCV